MKSQKMFQPWHTMAIHKKTVAIFNHPRGSPAQPCPATGSAGTAKNSKSPRNVQAMSCSVAHACGAADSCMADSCWSCWTWEIPQLWDLQLESPPHLNNTHNTIHEEVSRTSASRTSADRKSCTWTEDSPRKGAEVHTYLVDVKTKRSIHLHYRQQCTYSAYTYCVYVYVCVSVYVYAYVYVSAYVHVYVYVYIYIYV